MTGLRPRRRAFLLGAASLGVGGLAACGRARQVKTTVHAGVDFTLLVHPDAPATYPVVVAIHGIGGAPEHWVDGWRRFPGRAPIALPRGFLPHEGGFSWFPWSADMKSEKLAADASAAEERLWKGILELAASRRVVVAGYAQGAVFSFVMAARRADVVLGGFPVAGACPDALLPKDDKVRAAPVIAFHGAADDEFPIDGARAAVDAFTRHGQRAELRAYPGVRHAPSDKLHADLNAEMVKTMDAAR